MSKHPMTFNHLFLSGELEYRDYSGHAIKFDPQTGEYVIYKVKKANIKHEIGRCTDEEMAVTMMLKELSQK